MASPVVVLISSTGERFSLHLSAAIRSSFLLRDFLDDAETAPRSEEERAKCDPPSGKKTRDASTEKQSDAGTQATTYEVPVPSIPTHVLCIVVSHMLMHESTSPKEIPRPLRESVLDYLEEGERSLIEGWTPTLAMEVLQAANFLNAPRLRDLAAAVVAQQLMDCSVGEIRNMFGIEHGFTEEEEALLRKGLE